MAVTRQEHRGAQRHQAGAYDCNPWHSLSLLADGCAMGGPAPARLSAAEIQIGDA
jgi:hypothetical protein